MRICELCGRDESVVQITDHHVINEAYMQSGTEPIIRDFCIECHTKFHSKLKDTIRCMIRNQPVQQTVIIGTANLNLTTGSIQDQLAFPANPKNLFGMDFYNKESRFKENFDFYLSDGSILCGVGSPQGWFTFVIAECK